MNVRDGRKLLRASAGAALALVCATALNGCSIPIADLPLIGVPSNAPARQENPPAYMPVHDVPPPRDEAVPTVDEQKKTRDDLLAARDKQNAEASALAKSATK